MTVYDIRKHFGAVGDGVADDAPSFVAAANALTGTRGHTLYLPKGIYRFNSNPVINGRNLSSSSLLFLLEGIKQVRIVGDGGRSANTIIRLNGRCGQLGARGQRQNGNFWARTADVAAGTMSVQLIDPTKYTLYIPGDYTLLCGINIQDSYSVTPGGYGFPSNLQVFEYIQIDTVNSSGVVTFKTPVRYNYLSTWPNINIGNAFEINAGGPAGMYALFPSWDLDVEWEGICFENTTGIGGTQLYADNRRVVYRDCSFFSGNNPIPTQDGYWGADRCTCDVIMEVDKLIEEMEMTNCFWRGVDFQSASVRRSLIQNCYIYAKLNGSGADIGVVKDSHIPGAQFFAGAFAYGVCDAYQCENVRGVAGLQMGGLIEGGPTGGPGFSSFADKVDGTIIIPNGSNEANITDNGAGKTRITIAPEYSAIQWKVGKTAPLGNTYQYMRTVGITPIGTNVLTFASVPGWITPGSTPVLGQDSGYTGMPATQSIVTAVTATTVTLSLNTTGNIPNNFQVGFFCAPLSSTAKLITAVDLANNTIDIDHPFPAGYVYGSSVGTATWLAARWAVPGHSVYWAGTMGPSKSFKVLAIRQDANFTYVDTDEPGGMPLSLVPNSGAINIQTPGTQHGTWSGLTGSDVRLESINDVNSQNKPFGSYIKTQLTAGPPAAGRLVNTPSVWGHLDKVIIDVVTPYTGSAPNCFLHFNLFDNFAINVDGVRLFIGWAVDIRQAGKRVITPANIGSNPTALPGDVITVPNWSQILWLNSTFNFWYRNSAAMGGGGGIVVVANEHPSKWPVINIEVYCDQGFGLSLVVAASAGAYALTGTSVGLTRADPVVANMGGGPNMVERSLFSSNTPTLPYSQWYMPGNGSPAISTSDYYLMNGVYWTRPYDLNAMGSEGAAIKTREGGKRYVWVMWSDHIGNFLAGAPDLYVGYSSDPQIMPDPSTMRVLYPYNTTFNLVDQNGYTQNNVIAYQIPHLVYNPDPGAFAPFYIYAEGLSYSSARQHQIVLITTSDFLTYTFQGPAIPTTANSGWTSYGRPERLGVNNWMVYTFGKVDGGTGPGGATSPTFYKYTSTNGWAWTPDYSKVISYPGPHVVTISGQTYSINKEVRADNDYLTLFAVGSDGVNTGATIRISTAFGPSTGADQVFPGPTYLQDTEAYEEDGVVTIYTSRGFPPANHDATNDGPFRGNSPCFYTINGSITSNVLTVNSVPGGVPPLAVGFRILQASGKSAITSFGTGTGGVGTYNMSSTGNIVTGSLTVITNGGLWHQFVDIYYLVTDPTAAANAAPFGVKAKCIAGTVTISWNDVPPGRSYRVYRGTTAATQTTLIGDVTGVSITNTPTPGSQYFYKVVALNGGVEQQSRVVDVYASNNTEMVNRHVNRVINDGGDVSKINMTFLASADAWLTSNDAWRYVNWWVDARFGIKTDGSGFISKVYCLGTTRLPRGGDYTPTTSNTFPSTSSNTSYSATSFRGTTPSWVNNATTAHGYFGNGRYGNLQRWNEITLLAAYQKPGTASAGFFGYGEFDGMYLRHDSGASGNITFAMSEFLGGNNPYTTATVPFTTATAAHVAAGVFNGSSMTAYLDGVAGTPVSTPLLYNPELLKTSVLRGSMNANTNPALGSGSTTGSKKPLYGLSNEALYTGAGLAVFNKGLSATLVQSWGALYS